jgi:hypothetical protein
MKTILPKRGVQIEPSKPLCLRNGAAVNVVQLVDGSIQRGLIQNRRSQSIYLASAEPVSSPDKSSSCGRRCSAFIEQFFGITRLVSGSAHSSREIRVRLNNSLDDF